MRVVIAEDEGLFRQGLLLVLQQQGLDVVACAVDATEVPLLVEEHRPDVVVTDIRMPPMLADDGLRAAVQLRRGNPGIAVMVLSQFVQRRYAEELIAGGAAGIGYQLKQRVADAAAFTRDLRAIADGGTALDAEVVDLLVARAGRARREGGTLDRLTPRQREVLALIAQGRSNSAIAATLNVSERAVVQHTSAIYEALDLPPDDTDHHRRVLAVLRYLIR